jgi:hypothetical protein
MITSVYLSCGSLEAVTGLYFLGRYIVKSRCSYEIPESLFVKGAIVSQEALSDFLNRLWEEKALPRTGLSLVINCGQFITRFFSLPLLTDREVCAQLLREFSDTEQIKQPVIEYLPLSLSFKSRSRKVMGLCTERSYISALYETFTGAGLSLISIDADFSALLRLLCRHPDIKNNCCFVLSLKKSELFSFIFINGSYIFSERSALNVPEDSQACLSALLRSLSLLIQFLQSQKSRHTIKDLFIYGLSQAVTGSLRQSLLADLPGLRVSELNLSAYIRYGDKKLPEQLIYPVSGLRLLPGKRGFLSSYITAAERAEKAKKLVRHMAPLAALMLVFFAWWYSLFSLRLLNMRELAGLLDLLGDERLVSAQAMYDDYAQRLGEAEALNRSAEKALGALGSYPLLSSAVAASLEGEAGGLVTAQIISYDGESGRVGLVCSSEDEWLIHRFIDRLKSNSLVKELDYSGYELNQNGGFDVEVGCYLVPEAGRQDKSCRFNGSSIILSGGGAGELQAD